MPLLVGHTLCKQWHTLCTVKYVQGEAKVGKKAMAKEIHAPIQKLVLALPLEDQ